MTQTFTPSEVSSAPPSSITYVSDEIGNAEDSCSIQIAGQRMLYAESWEIDEAILSQPAKFTVRIGWQDTALSLFYNTCHPRTLVQLFINGALQMSGRIDRAALKQAQGEGGQSLEVTGRDLLAPVYDGHVRAETSFKDSTYFEMVKTVFKSCGIDPSKLQRTNTNNRSLKAGIPISEIAPAQVVDQIQQVVPGTIGAISANLHARAGMGRLEYLRKQLDRAGLMLWAAADGTFVLSAPNASQKPSYTIYRSISPSNGANWRSDGTTNILAWSLEDDATNRHSEIIIYGRGGGRKAGAKKSKAFYDDAEMLGWGYDQAVIHRDEYVQTGAQAAYLARRKIAEARREGYKLEYVIAGHTLPVGTDPHTRAVVTPDTTVQVYDEVLGLDGVFYVEGVKRTRGPETSTTIRLMRPVDLVFGDVSGPPAPTPVVSKKAVAAGTRDTNNDTPDAPDAPEDQ